MRLKAICTALAAVGLLASTALAGPAATDTNYFDGFADTAGVDPFNSVDVELDALGGVRLRGNGTSAPALWTDDADFRDWVTYRPEILIDNPLIPVSTLSVTPVPGSLALSPTPLAFRRVQQGPVLGPPPALSVDGYGVGGMSVARVDFPDAVYYMYYTGFPEDGYTKRIYLARSDDGLTWTKDPTPILDLGAPGTFDSRQLGKPSVLYDPADTPKFRMWYSAEGDLYGSIGYATSEDGVTWEKWVEPITVPDAAGDVGTHASLAIGADGLPIVAYHDADNGDLKFLHCGDASCSSGNTVVTLDADGVVGEYASLAVGVDGLPIVAYYDATNGDLKFLHCGTAACTLGNTITVLDGVAPDADVGRYASLRLGPAGFPFVAYYDATFGDLKAAACNDVLCAGGDETVSIVDDGAGNDVGQHASVALVATDPLNPATTTFPAVAYQDYTARDLRLVVCNDALCAGSDETPATVHASANDVGQFASLAVGAGGFPVIAYYDATDGNLDLLACDDPFCAGGDVPVVLDGSTNDVGQFASLVVGASGFPSVAYYDATDGNLLLVRCNDAACTGGDDLPAVLDGVDPPADVGQYASLAIGAGGLPLVAYYDADGQDLKVAPAERVPREVLGPGLIGSIDSYTVSQPCVLHENGVYRMWYTANDSNNLRIAYASSTDAVTWVRGGLQLDVGSGNIAYGVLTPTVWKEGSTYNMVFTGWKSISAGTAVQSKLMGATSADGTSWTYGSGNIALNVTDKDAFDGANLFLPFVLPDPATAPNPVTANLDKYKMWYVGNLPDDNGNTHDRIGYAYKTGTGGSWSKLYSAAPQGEVLGLGTQGTAFDSMYAADLAPVPEPGGGGGLIGFYTGTNAADFTPRIGAKRSDDGGVTWTDMPGLITPGFPVIDTDEAGAFDDGGVARPAPVDLGSEWAVYHSSLQADLTPSIGLHTVSYDFATVTGTGAALIPGGTDPAAVLDGSSILLYYASESGGIWGLSRATYDAAAPASQTAAPQALVFDEVPLCWDLDSSGTCDLATEDVNGDGYCTVADCHPLEAGGMRHPVVETDGVSWQLWYTAIGADGMERVAYAESDDGLSWTRMGLAVDRSAVPYDFAEQGVRPSGVLAGTSTRLFVTGVDRAGWQRAGLLDGAGPGFVDAGTATFQYPADEVYTDPAYLPRDWRTISWNPPAAPEGTTTEVWVSYYPTASDMWSNFFRIDNGRDLPFLLTVKAMRWQVRLAGSTADAAATPQLDDLTVDNADISFPATGRAVTIPVGPPAGRYLTAWGDLTITAEDNGGTVSVAIYDQEGTPLVSPTSVANGGWTTSLAGVPATSGKLILALDLTPNTVPSPPESPLLRSVNVTFSSTDVPSSITLVATPASLYSGQETSVAGWLESRVLNPDGSETVTPLPDQLVTLKTRAASEGSWTDLGTATSASDGSFAFPAQGPLGESRYFRAEWPGNVNVGGTVYPPAASSALVEVNDPPLVLTLDASSPSVLFGQRVTLSGSLTSSLGALLANQTVTIRQRAAGEADFTDLPTPLVLPVAPGGAFTTAGVQVLKPKVNTEYQVVWAGGDALGSGIIFPETTTVARVGVRPKVTVGLGLYGSRSGKYYLYQAGSRVRIFGRVTPKHYVLHDGVTRGTVLVEVFKLQNVDGVRTWVPYRSRNRLLGAKKNTSPYSWKWAARARGTYRTHTTFAGDTHHDPNVSVWRYFKVR